MTPTKARQVLETARLARTLVRIHRSCEAGHATGYVALVSDRLVLLSLVSDEIRFDGFQAFRLRDITKIEAPAPYFLFVERALSLRKLRRPRAPSKLDLSDISSLLLSARHVSPLLSIHRERADPDVCHIGVVCAATRTSVSLREISPDATWEAQPYRYKLAGITRVDFGGAYEEALHLVERASAAGKRQPRRGRGKGGSASAR